MEKLFIFFAFISSMIFISCQTDKKMFDNSLNTKDTTEKRILREDIAKKSPESEYGLFCKAWLFTLNKDNEKAIELYTKAIEISPDFEEAYYSRGLAYSDLRIYSKAIYDFDKVISFHQNFTDAYYNRGYAYLYSKKYSKGMSDFDKAIEISPDLADAYNKRGYAYDYLKESGKEILDYTKAIEINPNYAEAYKNRANIYYDLEEYSKAKADYTKAIEINPKYVSAKYSYEQRDFTISKGSKNYYAKISVAVCEDNYCHGPGTVWIYNKKTNDLFQILKSDDLYFSLRNNSSPTVNIIELYGENSPLIFDDFNFDGNEDLAIRNGNKSGYGGPSYDVYVFNITKKQFVLSSELTELASTNLGMFEIDKNRRRLITISKSGCCYHVTTEYKIAFGKGLIKVYESTEDATESDKYIIVYTKKLVNGVWKETVKKIKQ